MTTIGTLFSGFGGVDVGAMAAGLTPLWGIEYDADIADVARRNLGDHIITADILDIDPATLPAVDVLHASPPCPNFSVAKAGAEETEHDFAMAAKVAEFIRVIKPQIFTLENVYGYRKSKSWHIIRETLNECGYWMDVAHINAADFGVPQTRKRMIVRAVLGSWVPMLPPAERWVGWYKAIEDLIPTLPESRLAPWQVKRLPDELKVSCFVEAKNMKRDCTLRSVNDPSVTISSSLGERPSHTFCILVDGKLNNHGETLTSVNGEAPSFTVTTSHNLRDVRGVLVGNNANETSGAAIWTDSRNPAQTVRTDSGGRLQRAVLIGGANTSDEQARSGVGVSFANQPTLVINSSNSLTNNRAVLDNARVVAMTPRCLARFQTFPDWYKLPEKRTLAARGIGNAVPPLLYEKIIRQLVESVEVNA